jgi:hypothetical protein
MKNNRVFVYTLCYNESAFVKNFLSAYKDAEKIIVYDNQSTDNSVELLSQDSRVEIRIYDSGNQIRDDIYLEIKNNCWKEARGVADWVIIVDFDEIFSRCRLMNNGSLAVFDLDFSEAYDNGYNLIKAYGYNMNSFEAPLYVEGHPYKYSNKGSYHHPEEKPCCFRPDQIKDINFIAGSHWALPVGIDGRTDSVKILFHQDYKLLHYKFWNLKYYMDRMVMLRDRMSDLNKKMGWGYQYFVPLSDIHNSFVWGCDAAKPLFEIVRPND